MHTRSIICFMMSGFMISIGINLLHDVHNLPDVEQGFERTVMLLAGWAGAFAPAMIFFLLGVGYLPDAKEAEIEHAPTETGGAAMAEQSET